jgi:hypothetical protein
MTLGLRLSPRREAIDLRVGGTDFIVASAIAAATFASLFNDEASLLESF